MTERRRLSDKIIDAHAQALDEGKTHIAELLLRALEADLSSVGGAKAEKRQSVEEPAAAFERHDAVKKGR